MLKRIWLPIFCLLLAAAPAIAQEKHDGLELLGKGGVLLDKESDSEMTLYGFEGKYDEKLVGFYLTQHGKQVRFYVDTATWDKLKQKLIQTRDQWDVLSPTEFAKTGSVRGFRVANIRSKMRISIQGKTTLDDKRLNFSLDGGDNNPKRVFISITHDQVKKLVEQLYKVDELLRQ
jgi:hypothetical protein